MTKFHKLEHVKAPDFIEKWTKIGLSCEPADRSRAEAAIGHMYTEGGFSPPEEIIWHGDPYQMIQAWIEAHRNSLPLFVRKQISNDVRNRVRGNILGQSLTAAVDSMSVICMVKANVWNSVGKCVNDSIESMLCPDDVVDIVPNIVHGSHGGAQLVSFDYRKSVDGLAEQTNCLFGQFELAKSCGWILPGSRVCYASERHSTLKLDQQGRAHCDDGPAIVYPSGWSVYAHHGVAVSERVIKDPGGFTFQELRLDNDDVAKVVLEKIGLEKFLALPGTQAGAWNYLFTRIAEIVMD